MTNAYPEKPSVPYEKTTVAMAEVVPYLQSLGVPAAVKRTTYVIFRNESGNGGSGINNNYAGVQADSGRWPAQFDAAIVGVVTKVENGTGRERLFVAFGSWHTSVDFLADRVSARGLFVDGTTHQVVKMTIANANDLATAYQREWVTGSPTAVPNAQALASFLSMYSQAEGLFT